MDETVRMKHPRAEIEYDGYNFHFPCNCIYVLNDVGRGRWIFCEEHPEGPPPTESFIRSFCPGAVETVEDD